MRIAHIAGDEECQKHVSCGLHCVIASTKRIQHLVHTCRGPRVAGTGLLVDSYWEIMEKAMHCHIATGMAGSSA